MLATCASGLPGKNHLISIELPLPQKLVFPNPLKTGLAVGTFVSLMAPTSVVLPQVRDRLTLGLPVPSIPGQWRARATFLPTPHLLGTPVLVSMSRLVPPVDSALTKPSLDSLPLACNFIC